MLGTIAFHKQIVYIAGVIRNFADTETKRFFAAGKSRRLPPEILRRAVMRLTQLDAATRVEDLLLPPSNRLEALSGRRIRGSTNRNQRMAAYCFSRNWDVAIITTSAGRYFR